MTPGSSGGGWVTKGGKGYPVTSYGYDDDPRSLYGSLHGRSAEPVPGGEALGQAQAAATRSVGGISLRIRSSRGSVGIHVLMAAATAGWTFAIRSCIACATAR